MTELPDDMEARTPAPEGEAWRVVPVEPTEAMMRAAELAGLGDPDEHHETVIARLWSAMLAASPVVPVGSGETLERQAAEIERLREALEPIAARPVPDGCTDNALIGWISAGAIRKARAALTGEDTAGSSTNQNTEPGLAFSDAGEP